MPTHHCTQTDDGRRLHLRAGDRLRIELPERTTGHRWQVVASGALALPPAVPAASSASMPRPGAGTLRAFEAEVRAIGTHLVVIELRRPWEPATLAAAATYTLLVDVSP
ncbi:protease inhibitor I42 family protein [Variovorax sp. J22R24]|uniref:protease inhibitor I42 family protein n=1 Tax=Variovorax gracilis TaxID=3053502 RepID=UPI002575C9D1|nr:protease inhibitor I42 family protein [Variovorax sp. J22R24]MDM0110484.1 protease inhibitor I42 family protein [Variovorax sp. J22R24]